MTYKHSGELFLSGAISLWSFAAFFMQALNKYANGLQIVFWVNLVATGFLALVITFRRSWSFWSHWKEWIASILWVAAIIGILSYILLFKAAALTNPNNIAILNLTQILFGFMIYSILRIETVKIRAIVGSAIMIIGAFFVLYQDGFSFNRGDLLVLGANLCFVIGNIYQKKVRKVLGSYQILFLRSIISAFFLSILLLVSSEGISTDFPIQFWIIMSIMGVFVFCIEKVCWIEAIHRMAINRASSLSAITPALTILWGILFFDQPPSLLQTIGFIIMFIGAWYILRNKNLFQVLS